MRNKEEQKNNRRFAVYSAFVGAVALLIVARLFWMQIVQGEDYLNKAEQQQVRSIEVTAPRGEILDRYGRPIVSNKIGYSLQVQKTSLTNDDFNAVLLHLYNTIEEYGEEVLETLPISAPPYTFTFSEEEQDSQKALEAEREWKKADPRRYDENLSASEVMEKLRQRYKISEDYSPEDLRKIVAIRYEMELRGFSVSTPFTIASDINMNLVTKIKEEQADFPCVNVMNEYFRQFEQGSLAAHIVGRVGIISETEYEEHKNDGYKRTDFIGKEGIEKEYEEVLRGENGTSSLVQTSEGFEVQPEAEEAPVPGNYVVLTIDANLQRVMEETLGQTIEDIRSRGGDPSAKSGGDAYCGAAVAIEVNTGEVLAMATWPTYDPSTFNEMYTELLNDPNKPMWNRAVSGTYSPGSTYKMLTSIAALESGTITPQTIIRDEGVYRFYEGYQPACWLYRKNGSTHGNQNVTQALANSCNYFYYETGRLMGIETLNDYARRFGLGEYTGIGLSESKGRLAGPEDREQNGGGPWYDGDTLAAAIGQSDNLFTPIQIANYVATIANGGTRYKPHLVKAVRSTVDGKLISETEPEVVEQIDMKQETYDAVMAGMLGVTEDGTASSVFRNYPIRVGGKTGSVQVATGSDNGVFVAFAPFDDPQIAITVIIEHGNSGSDVAPVALAVFNEYFLKGEQQTEQENATPQGELMP